MPFDHAGFVVPAETINPDVQILRIAKDFLQDPDHWIKDQFRHKQGNLVQRCAIGAINAAARQVRVSTGVSSISSIGARKLLRYAIFDDDDYSGFQKITNDIINWNDDDQRQHSEIIAAFNKAITNGMMSGGPIRRHEAEWIELACRLLPQEVT